MSSFSWNNLPLLVINLDRRPDRLTSITAELAQLGRTLATGGGGPPTLRMSAVNNPADGALGCSLSHLKCLDLAIEQGWPAVVILEDDFACTDHAAFRHATDTFLAAQRHWDVLMLGCNVRMATSVGGAVDRVHAAWSAVGYVVHGTYLPTLRDNFRASITLLARQPTLRHMYALDVYWQRLQAQDYWFVCRPLTVIQAPGFSDIENAVVDYTEFMLRPPVV